MKNASYNAEDDILRLLWSNAPINESDEVEPGIILDYDCEGNVVGIEVLNASKKIVGMHSKQTADTLKSLLRNST